MEQGKRRAAITAHQWKIGYSSANYKARKSKKEKDLKKLTTLIIAATLMASLTACDEKTAEQKIEQQVKEKVHALTADERQRAQINAKQYFEKEWPIFGNKRGMLNECRPSDSNFNGLVTCSGMVPDASAYQEIRRYCGYTTDLVGCSDEDTVK